MIISFEHNEKVIHADLSQPIDISIRLKDGIDNPNCYWANPPKFKTITEGDFIGSVEEGGSVNYKKITFTPHGNGTHTECYGHISADKKAVIGNIKTINCLCQVISLSPKEIGNDQIIAFSDFKEKFDDSPGFEAVAIRTLENDKSKLTKKYTDTNPAYLEPDILEFLNSKGIKHLLLDLPSVDKEFDNGVLAGHKAFFGFPDSIRDDSTITELIYIDHSVVDGAYLLMLNPINIELDAGPSRPLLFKITGF